MEWRKRLTPTCVIKKYIEKSRQSGRTQALIESLPDEKCAILVLNHSAGVELKKRIKEQRPEYNVDNVSVLVYAPNTGWRDNLLLRDMHVYFDNDVIDELSIRQVDAVNQVYGKTKKT